MSPALVPLLLAVFVAVVLITTRRGPVIAATVEGDVLHVRLGIWDKIYCCRGDLTIAVSDVEGVAAAPRHLVPADGIRLPGTGIPGVIRAGSFGRRPTRDFWDVRKAETLLVIELRSGADYRRIVLELPDPSEVSRELRPRLGAFTGTFR